MTRTSREYNIGWLYSILLHLLLAVILMFITVRQYIPEPHFVEMSWGTLSSHLNPIPHIPSTEQAARKSNVTEGITDKSINLPFRKFLELPDEVISLRDKKKNIVAETPVSSARAGKRAADEQRSMVVSNGLGTRDNVIGKSSSQSNVTVAAPFGSGTESGGLGSNVSMAYQWAGGGNRKLVVGDVPSYPSGVNTSAQIKLKVIVLPDGTVRSATPAQKGDTRLENAAIAKVKLWQFEPLLSSQTQAEQICNVTFNFKLK